MFQHEQPLTSEVGHQMIKKLEVFCNDMKRHQSEILRGRR